MLCAIDVYINAATMGIENVRLFPEVSVVLHAGFKLSDVTGNKICILDCDYLYMEFWKLVAEEIPGASVSAVRKLPEELKLQQ